jgi:hypothetical protein
LNGLPNQFKAEPKKTIVRQAPPKPVPVVTKTTVVAPATRTIAKPAVTTKTIVNPAPRVERKTTQAAPIRNNDSFRDSNLRKLPRDKRIKRYRSFTPLMKKGAYSDIVEGLPNSNKTETTTIRTRVSKTPTPVTRQQRKSVLNTYSHKLMTPNSGRTPRGSVL